MTARSFFSETPENPSTDLPEGGVIWTRPPPRPGELDLRLDYVVATTVDGSTLIVPVVIIGYPLPEIGQLKH